MYLYHDHKNNLKIPLLITCSVGIYTLPLIWAISILLLWEIKNMAQPLIKFLPYNNISLVTPGFDSTLQSFLQTKLLTTVVKQTSVPSFELLIGLERILY